MTDVKRVAAGVPTGGQFAEHARPDAAATRVPRTGGPIRADQLAFGDVIHHGGTCLRVEAVSVHPLNGVTQVACGLGTLLMKSDQQVIVAPSDADVRPINVKAPTDDEFLSVLGGAGAHDLYTGDVFTRDSVESSLHGLDTLTFAGVGTGEWASDDSAEHGEEWLDSPAAVDEVWDRMRDTQTWRDIDRHGFGHDGRDQLETLAMSCAVDLMREKGWIA